MRARMVFSEAFRSIGANASTTIAATMTVLIGMFLLGLLVALGTWVNSWSDQAKGKLEAKVYFCTPLTCGTGYPTEKQIGAVGKQLLAMPEVKSIEFVSKEEALKIMRKRTPELANNVSTNPLPDAYEVTPNRAEDLKLIANRIETSKPAGVQTST